MCSELDAVFSIERLYDFVLWDVGTVMVAVDNAIEALEARVTQKPANSDKVSQQVQGLRLLVEYYVRQTGSLPEQKKTWGSYTDSEKRFWGPTIRQGLLLSLEHGHSMRQSITKTVEALD